MAQRDDEQQKKYDVGPKHNRQAPVQHSIIGTEQQRSPTTANNPFASLTTPIAICPFCNVVVPVYVPVSLTTIDNQNVTTLQTGSDNTSQGNITTAKPIGRQYESFEPCTSKKIPNLSNVGLVDQNQVYRPPLEKGKKPSNSAILGEQNSTNLSQFPKSSEQTHIHCLPVHVQQDQIVRPKSAHQRSDNLISESKDKCSNQETNLGQEESLYRNLSEESIAKLSLQNTFFHLGKIISGLSNIWVFLELSDTSKSKRQRQSGHLVHNSPETISEEPNVAAEGVGETGLPSMQEVSESLAESLRIVQQILNDSQTKAAGENIQKAVNKSTRPSNRIVGSQIEQVPSTSQYEPQEYEQRSTRTSTESLDNVKVKSSILEFLNPPSNHKHVDLPTEGGLRNIFPRAIDENNIIHIKPDSGVDQHMPKSRITNTKSRNHHNDLTDQRSSSHESVLKVDIPDSKEDTETDESITDNHNRDKTGPISYNFSDVNDYSIIRCGFHSPAFNLNLEDSQTKDISSHDRGNAVQDRPEPNQDKKEIINSSNFPEGNNKEIKSVENKSNIESESSEEVKDSIEECWINPSPICRSSDNLLKYFSSKDNIYEQTSEVTDNKTPRKQNNVSDEQATPIVISPTIAETPGESIDKATRKVKIIVTRSQNGGTITENDDESIICSKFSQLHPPNLRIETKPIVEEQDSDKYSLVIRTIICWHTHDDNTTPATNDFNKTEKSEESVCLHRKKDVEIEYLKIEDKQEISVAADTLISEDKQFEIKNISDTIHDKRAVVSAPTSDNPKFPNDNEIFTSYDDLMDSPAHRYDNYRKHLTRIKKSNEHENNKPIEQVDRTVHLDAAALPENTGERDGKKEQNEEIITKRENQVKGNQPEVGSNFEPEHEESHKQNYILSSQNRVQWYTALTGIQTSINCNTTPSKKEWHSDNHHRSLKTNKLNQHYNKDLSTRDTIDEDSRKKVLVSAEKGSKEAAHILDNWYIRWSKELAKHTSLRRKKNRDSNSKTISKGSTSTTSENEETCDEEGNLPKSNKDEKKMKVNQSVLPPSNKDKKYNLPPHANKSSNSKRTAMGNNPLHYPCSTQNEPKEENKNNNSVDSKKSAELEFPNMSAILREVWLSSALYTTLCVADKDHFVEDPSSDNGASSSILNSRRNTIQFFAGLKLNEDHFAKLEENPSIQNNVSESLPVSHYDLLEDRPSECEIREEDLDNSQSFHPETDLRKSTRFEPNHRYFSSLQSSNDVLGLYVASNRARSAPFGGQRDDSMSLLSHIGTAPFHVIYSPSSPNILVQDGENNEIVLDEIIYCDGDTIEDEAELANLEDSKVEYSSRTKEFMVPRAVLLENEDEKGDVTASTHATLNVSFSNLEIFSPVVALKVRPVTSTKMTPVIVSPETEKTTEQDIRQNNCVKVELEIKPVVSESAIGQIVLPKLDSTELLKNKQGSTFNKDLPLSVQLMNAPCETAEVSNDISKSKTVMLKDRNHIFYSHIPGVSSDHITDQSPEENNITYDIDKSTSI